jgi:hypothetical protein
MVDLGLEENFIGDNLRKYGFIDTATAVTAIIAGFLAFVSGGEAGETAR